MKQILPVVFFLWQSVLLNAQPQISDSLKSAINNTTADTTRIQLISFLTQYYLNNNLDSAVAYGLQMIKLSSANNYTYGLCEGYIYVSRAYNRVGNYADGLKMVLRALHTAEQLERGKNQILCSGYFQLGALHMVMKRIQDAKNSLRRSLDFGEQLKPADYYMSLAMLGNVYRQANVLDSAFMYTWQAHELSLRSNRKGPQAFILSVLGDTYNSRNLQDSAIHFYKQSIRQAEENVNHFFAARSLTGLAELFHKIGAHDSSTFYGRKALALAQQYNYQLYVLNASQVMMKSYESNNTDSTLKYMKVMLSANDSMYNQVRAQQFTTALYDEQQRQQQAREAEERYRNKNRLFALITAVCVVLVIAGILYRSNRQKQKVNAQLQQALSNLKATQAQLIQSEKMASLGELTAGIAHEIQNPLNFVNNFSEVNTEIISDLKTEAQSGNIEEVIALTNTINENLLKITHHGKRADAIVKGMLLHSRASTGKREPTNINALADEYLRLSYHGYRAKDKNYNANIKTEFDKSIGAIEVAPQDVGRVLLNLFNNAFYAAHEKKQKLNESVSAGQAGFEPTVEVKTEKRDGSIWIMVRDNGSGIPQNLLDKIYQPFFTTKPTGEGTGLGLSMSYDIIKAHGGDMKVNTKEGEGAEFTIILPVH